MKNKVEWVVMGPAPYLAHCTRCGGVIEPPPMPTPLRAFVKYCSYVLEIHRHCKEQKFDRVFDSP